jgi:hypothetical protein
MDYVQEVARSRLLAESDCKNYFSQVLRDYYDDKK